MGKQYITLRCACKLRRHWVHRLGERSSAIVFRCKHLGHLARTLRKQLKTSELIEEIESTSGWRIERHKKHWRERFIRDSNEDREYFIIGNIKLLGYDLAKLWSIHIDDGSYERIRENEKISKFGVDM